MDEQWQDAVKKLYCLLDLKRRAVGMRNLWTEEEFEAAEAMTPKESANYCGILRAATAGRGMKLKDAMFRCRSGAKTLGVEPKDEQNQHGENWTRMGLYENQATSEKVRHHLTYNPQQPFGVLAEPLEACKETPDVIILITNPYNVMRITQGYAYHYGAPQNINFIGNQALCLETTTNPYMTKDLNISMLCIGTRHRMGWGDDEMSVGIYKDKFIQTVDGLFQTFNQMESNQNKKRIQAELDRAGIPAEIRWDWNYYDDV